MLCVYKFIIISPLQILDYPRSNNENISVPKICTVLSSTLLPHCVLVSDYIVKTNAN